MRNRMRRAKKGISLLEVMVSLMILSLILSSLLSICRLNYRARLLKREKEKAARIVYCLEEELKYNYSLEEVEANLQEGEVSLSWDENFMDGLIASNVFSMERGSDINIKLLEEDKGLARIQITISKDIKGLDIEEEKTFIKDRYMNESYKE